MARNIQMKDIDLGQRIIDLQQNHLFDELSPEEISIIARNTHSKNFDLKDLKKTVKATRNNFIFIISGQFEKIYFPTGKSHDNTMDSISLKLLTSGDYWGEHNLTSIGSVDFLNRIGLKAVSEGRLIYIAANKMKVIMTKWPSIQNKLFDSILKRSSEECVELGSALADLENRNYILNRVDSVGKALSNMLVNIHNPEKSNHGISEQVQTKHLLSEMPDIKKINFKKTYLEQAYLPHDHEDRIRSMNNEIYTRSIKLGYGKTRTLQEYNISPSEFSQLLKGRIPNSHVIKKDRYEINLKKDMAVISIDEFLGEGNLKGLFLAEINFLDPSASDDKSCTIPSWLTRISIKDVTEDKLYSNYNLALHGKPK